MPQSAPFNLVTCTVVKPIRQTDPRTGQSAWTAIQIVKVTLLLSLTYCWLSVRSATGYQGLKVWVFTRATQSSNWNGYGNSNVCLWWLGKKNASPGFVPQEDPIWSSMSYFLRVWGVVHIDYMIQYLISRLCLSFYVNKTCHIIDGIKI